jgi:hypothetical protein
LRPKRASRGLCGHGSAMDEITLDRLKGSTLYSEELGIRLDLKTDDEPFKWFLASLLFGTRISETIAKRTYRAFEKYDLLAPSRILDAGWDFLVHPVMKEGGYVRYDEKTSRRVLNNCHMLLKEYEGSLNALHERADDGRDLERRLLAFYGVGPVTVNIFLRELRPFWEKDHTGLSQKVVELAGRHSIDIGSLDPKNMAFIRVEAGLIRLRKELVRPFA